MLYSKLNSQPEFRRSNFSGPKTDGALSKSLDALQNEVTDSGILAPLEKITTELLIKTLRSSEPPETVYWMLRYYLESGGDPIITTNRDKTIYLDVDPLEQTISVFIGESEDVCCVGQYSNKKIFAMNLTEKYDYVWYDEFGTCLRRHYSAEAMLLEKRREMPEDWDTEQVAMLFFTVGEDSVAVVQIAQGPYAGTYSLPAIFATQTDKYSLEYKLCSVVDLLKVS